MASSKSWHEKLSISQAEKNLQELRNIKTLKRVKEMEAEHPDCDIIYGAEGKLLVLMPKRMSRKEWDAQPKQVHKKVESKYKYVDPRPNQGPKIIRVPDGSGKKRLHNK